MIKLLILLTTLSILSCENNSPENKNTSVEINFVKQFSELYDNYYIEHITSYIDKSNGNLIYIVTNGNGTSVFVVENHSK